MTLFDRLIGWMDGAGGRQPEAQAPAHSVQAYTSVDLADSLALAVLGGSENASGAVVNRRTVLRNSAVARCVFLISNSIGMLPLHLLQASDGGKTEKARDHPLFDVLSAKASKSQSAFVFRRLMQHRVLTDGNAYAYVVRARGRVLALHPIAPDRVTPEQRDDWSVIYKVRDKSGGERTVQPEDMLHIMGPSEDGIKGLALTDYAADVLGLSLRAQEAAARVFRNGMMVGGALQTEGKLTDTAIAHLRASIEERFSGSENAGKSLILEEGLKYQPMSTSSKDAQNLETRQHQIEEVARIFGVPRPFLMVDDTSWGTGIEQLGIFFVQYGLAPWFKAWEEAISMTLLTDQERKDRLFPKFNERALLRGSMEAQANFLSKLVGTGGAPQIMEQNEARGFLDLSQHADGGGLSKGSAAAMEGSQNAPPQPA